MCFPNAGDGRSSLIHKGGRYAVGDFRGSGASAEHFCASNGSVITPFPFNSLALDFVQNLGAGIYELSASGSVNAGVNDAGGSESITATIVPEPVALSIMGAAALCVFWRRFRPVSPACILRA